MNYFNKKVMNLNMSAKELAKDPTWEFLNIRDYEGNVVGSWWEAWDNLGWEKIWKQFLNLVHKDYVSMSEEDKKSFEIVDTKSKYGTLRVYTTNHNDNLTKLEWELEHISGYTCEKCGKQPLNKDNKHIIWTSRGYWIENLCRKCAIKKSSEKMLNECFEESSDSGKMTLSVNGVEKTWNPWKNYTD